MDDLYTPNLTEVEKFFEEGLIARENRGHHGGPSRTITAENAIVDAVFSSNRNGFVTITYEGRGRQRETVTLVVSPSTRITDQFGNRMNFRGLRKNMVVNARFSSMMTRSIPPQSNAYSITVVKEDASSLIDEGRVISVTRDNRFHFLLTGNPRDINTQTRYVISRDTKIRNRRGNRISINDIRPGDWVRIERASFQTASIPPQTSAFSVQIM